MLKTPERRLQNGFRVALCLAGSGLISFAAHAVEVLEGPTLTMDPNGLTPLAGVVEMVTDVEVRARLTITDGQDLWTVHFPVAAQEHAIPVLGLKPGRSYTVDIAIVPGGPVGSVFATTGPLPDDFPVLVTNVSIPQQMEPGFTLIDCFRRTNDDTRPFYSSIVDEAGEVVWYTTQCFAAARMLVNGHIFFRSGPIAYEMDLLGNFRQVPLDAPGLGLHHDLLRTPHGTYLSLTQRTVDVLEFPTSDTDPAAPMAPATLLDDSVVEFLPDGTLRREWPLVEMIDPLRIGYGSLRETDDGLDWTHSNAVNYRAEDDSIIVSVRHQDAVIKFTRETGELDWILGPPANWSPEFQPYLLTPVGSPFSWQFHQHAPMWTEDGTLLLFDNGNFRASPFDGTPSAGATESFSRGVEFAIDESGMEVREVWTYGENLSEQIYASFISDADSLETTGNRLITFGGTNYVGGVTSEDLGLGSVHARIIETTGDAIPTKVFDLTAYDAEGGRIAVYRSERIPDLYPQSYVRVPNTVGDSLRMDNASRLPQLLWTASPTDSEHDPADYYMVHASASPDAGFGMLDSTALTQLDTAEESGSLTFFKIVAANVAGSSGDEPPR